MISDGIEEWLSLDAQSLAEYEFLLSRLMLMDAWWNKEGGWWVDRWVDGWVQMVKVSALIGHFDLPVGKLLFNDASSTAVFVKLDLNIVGTVRLHLDNHLLLESTLQALGSPHDSCCYPLRFGFVFRTMLSSQ